jgi:hypothetical protein
MWQQCIHGYDLVSWGEKNIGSRPTVLWPIITNLCNLQIDDIIYTIYIDHLIHAAQLYKDNSWQKPQWLHISDLEALASLSEKGVLNIETLLQQKATKYRNRKFDLFLYEQFGGKDIIDKNLIDRADSILGNTMATFWNDIVKSEKTS